MKFEKLAFNQGYWVLHRGVVVIVKKQDNGNWLAQCRKRDGIRFVEFEGWTLRDEYSHAKTRGKATQSVIKNIDDRADRDSRFADLLAHLDGEYKEQEAEHLRLLGEADGFVTNSFGSDQ